MGCPRGKAPTKQQPTSTDGRRCSITFLLYSMFLFVFVSIQKNTLYTSERNTYFYGTTTMPTVTSYCPTITKLLQLRQLSVRPTDEWFRYSDPQASQAASHTTGAPIPHSIQTTRYLWIRSTHVAVDAHFLTLQADHNYQDP